MKSCIFFKLDMGLYKKYSEFEKNCDECLETLYEERIYSLREDAVKAMNKNMSDEK